MLEGSGTALAKPSGGRAQLSWDQALHTLALPSVCCPSHGRSMAGDGPGESPLSGAEETQQTVWTAARRHSHFLESSDPGLRPRDGAGRREAKLGQG